MGDWCTIESDPGVFTELISGMGVQGVQVEELFTLDVEELQSYDPAYGLVFLFKWQKSGNQECLPYVPENLFFARQVITNACATQAILSVLLNSAELAPNLGPILTDFKEFTTGFGPEDTGEALSNCDPIREVHNSFARPDAFVMESKSGKKQDAFHFVGYVPVNGHLYELDGLQPGPIDHGEVGADTWKQHALQVIQDRISSYDLTELRFTLLVLTRNRKELYQEELQKAEAQVEEALQQGDDATVSELTSTIHHLKDKIAMEERKFQTYKVENIRRKQNYIPFMINFLRVLSDKGELEGLVEKAKAKAKDRQQQEQTEKSQRTSATSSS